MNAASETPAAPGLSREGLARFCNYITGELGIKMSDAKLPLLQSRLQRRLRVLGLNSLEEYQKHLFDPAKGDDERVHFFNAITTNKTDFFREPKHFEYLVQTALKNLEPSQIPGAAPAPWHFRLWCAGCSSGEEPYTLTMVLSEFAGHRPGFDFWLLATDISTRVLEHAQGGIYEEERIGPVAPALRSKYLLRSKDRTRAQVRIIPELRRKIAFRRLNFMDAQYGVTEMFEVIFFRNVMIYFDKPTQEKVIHKLCRNLVPGGYLFVGHSESLAGLDLPVACLGQAIYRKPA
ncbi:MAG: protein-glutamate O-methyltransferase CheR [Verrucomicrobiae bacterium]|nr:protein-glutamate O-methyltransferase CheR [Verrucomicrobiae bacterium]